MGSRYISRATLCRTIASGYGRPQARLDTIDRTIRTSVLQRRFICRWFGFQDVRQIDLDETGKVVGEKSIEIGQRVRDVKVAPDGQIIRYYR